MRILGGIVEQSAGIIPVSYTHLDVYKRQELLGKGKELAAKLETEVTAVLIGYNAVSYTHLLRRPPSVSWTRSASLSVYSLPTHPAFPLPRSAMD